MTFVTARALHVPALLSAALLAGVPACQCDDGVAVIPGDVVGRVCDVDTGEGLGGVALTLESGPRVLQGLTAADGTFRFTRVFPGPAVILAPEGRSFALEVESGVDAIVTDIACREPAVAPTTGGVDGQVCNRHTGALVTDADVLVLTASEVFRTRTGDDGTFALEGLPAGAHVLTVQAEGFARSFALDVAAGEVTHLDLGEHCVETGLAQGTLSGALCDPSDETGALVGARVTVTDALGAVVNDVTDTDGAFFVNALAPGPASVAIVRAPDVNDLYDVTVVAGRDVVVERGLTCNGGADCSYQVVGAPVVDERPVDIVFVIDDSGSMDNDNAAVRDNINAFSSSIAAAGVDHRVVLVGTTNVPPPLGGSAQFKKINTNVDSNDALRELVDHRNGILGFLREDSVKHFVAITDDESDMSANNFKNQVATWPGFESWTFHSIVAFGNNEERGCSTGAAYGHQYVQLTEETGGVMSPICDADYAAVFDAVVAAVTTVTMPCTLDVGAPDGVTTDPSRMSVTYAGTTLPVRGTCNGPGWRYDPAAQSVTACPDTCAQLALDDGAGTIVADVGCFED